MIIAGAWFGGFQALMPIIGYFLGSFFIKLIEKYDHWVAFLLLAFIGGKMVKEALADDEEKQEATMGWFNMMVLAIATSIDALAVGITLALLKVEIISASVFIGCVTFVFSAAGVFIGSKFGETHKTRAEVCGGIILILLGIKILLQGLGII